MDHLVQIHGSTISSPRVPYLCNEDYSYDNGGFMDYPFRCGMRKRKDDPGLIRMEKSGVDLETVAPFLQAWLFFGTLQDILGGMMRTHFVQEDFICHDELGVAYITTERLPKYIWYWAAYESGIPLDVNVGAAMTAEILFNLDLVIDELIQDDRAECNWFSTASFGTDRSRSPGHLVLLSLAILSETLVTSWNAIYATNEKIHLRVSHGLFFPNILKERLRNAGWCSGEIEALDLSGETYCSSAFLLSRMNRHILGKSHLSCDKDRCKAYDMDHHTYKSKHVMQECRCKLLPGANGAANLCISWILDDGGMPLVLLSDPGRDDEAFVNVIYCPIQGNKPVPRFVAISHVWSDGMGNEGNSMPLCTLRKLQTQVNALFDATDDPVPFWIDTLCVPKTNKIPALQIMSKSYRLATVVLVMDAGLEMTSMIAHPQERLLRIKVSTWMSRLWTLQEALFAQKLYFQFAEAACTAGSILNDCCTNDSPMKLQFKDLLTRDKNSPYKNKLIRAIGADSRNFDLQGKRDQLVSRLAETYPNFPSAADKRLAEYINRHPLFDPVFEDNHVAVASLLDSQTENEDFDIRHPSRTLSSLKRRHTSRLEDEPFCLATLMGVQVLPILAVSPASRLKKLLTTMTQLPPTLLFSHQYPHYEEDGFRWAPTTFMDRGAVSYNTERMGRAFDRGLRVSMSGLSLDSGGSLPDDDELEIGVRDDRLTYKLTLLTEGETGTTKWGDFNAQALRIILRCTLYEGHSMPFDAALVSLVEHQEDIQIVRFLTTLWISATGRLVKDRPSVLLSKWLPVESEWCVL